MTEREALARIIDEEAFELLLADLDDDRQALVLDRRSDALAKADQWLSRPSPVDGVVEALRPFAGVVALLDDGLTYSICTEDGAVIVEDDDFRNAARAIQAKEPT